MDLEGLSDRLIILLVCIFRFLNSCLPSVVLLLLCNRAPYLIDPNRLIYQNEPARAGHEECTWQARIHVHRSEPLWRSSSFSSMNLARHSITSTTPIHISDARFDSDCKIFTVSTPAGFAVYRTCPLQLIRKRGIFACFLNR